MKMKELQIIYKHNKPYGIRDIGGYLLFFTDISKFSNQEERYRQEIAQQYKLADFLLASLQRHNQPLDSDSKKPSGLAKTLDHIK